LDPNLAVVLAILIVLLAILVVVYLMLRFVRRQG
jgi:hypothetical protein